MPTLAVVLCASCTPRRNGYEHNVRDLYLHFALGKVSVDYFLRCAKNGPIVASIVDAWGSVGQTAQLQKLIEMAEKVKAKPSRLPFAW